MEPKTARRAERQGENTQARMQTSETTSSGGLPLGTVILTMAGEMPVEALTPGARIISRDAGMVRVLDVRRRTVVGKGVRIAAGSLGDTRPDCEMVLPAGQQVLVRDWRAQAMFGKAEALVPAEALIDGEFVRGVDPCIMTLVEVICERAHVLYAGGLEVACSADDASEIRAAV